MLYMVSISMRSAAPCGGRKLYIVSISMRSNVKRTDTIYSIDVPLVWQCSQSRHGRVLEYCSTSSADSVVSTHVLRYGSEWATEHFVHVKALRKVST